DYSGSAAAFNNYGTLTKTAGAGMTSFGLPFSNSGTVEIQSGNLSFAGDFTQTDGSTSLNGHTLSVPGTADIQGGRLSGPGTIRGNLKNAGRIDPGGQDGTPGLLMITGDFTQTADGTLDINLAGDAPQYDQLSISGKATLAGGLNVDLLDGFQP